MADASTDYREYSPNYYAYHRNSIAAAFLLAVSTFPGVELDLGQLVWIKDEHGVLAAAIPIGLFLAAWYCLGIFSIEWYLQALPDARKLQTMYSVINNFLDEHIKNAEKAIKQWATSRTKAELELDAIIATVPASIQDLMAQSNNKLAEIHQQVLNLAEVAVMSALPPHALVGTYFDKGDTEVLISDRVKADIKQRFDHSRTAVSEEALAYVEATATEYIREMLKNIDTRLKKLKTYEEILDRAAKQLSDPITEIRKLIRKSNKPTLMRVWFFGLAPPVGITLAASAIFVASYFR